MSVTVDANLLLYASDRASRFYDPATVTLRRLAQGPGLVYLFWPVIMAYLRIATHSAIFDSPLAPDEATGNIDSLLRLPHVRSPSEDEIFWITYMDVTAPRPGARESGPRRAHRCTHASPRSARHLFA